MSGRQTSMIVMDFVRKNRYVIHHDLESRGVKREGKR